MARTEPRPPAQALARADVRVAAAVAGFHRELSLRLLEGARSRLAESGLDPERLDDYWVPGSFELPLTVRSLAETGRYAAVIALGVVIRGETPHFEYVSDVAASGISHAGLETGVPCTFGVLTCDTIAQAEARAGGAVGNAGEDAADAAVAMANLIEELRAPAG
jgi:6,7-dimethyl-8-ribityllumazine synthase